jgi:sugar lactone lactonase YvrE
MSRTHTARNCLAGVAMLLLAGQAWSSAQIRGTGGEKGGVDATGPYDVVKDWPQPLSADWTWGRTGGVWAESADRVYVLQTGDMPVIKQKPGAPRRNAVDAPGTRFIHKFLVFDRAGKLIESFEQHNELFTHPHSLKMNPYDPERHIWAVDGRSNSGEASHQVWKFTREGKLVMTLGEHKVPGTDQAHFGGPTDIAFLPNGDFYIADGYRNGRIVKFNKDGKYLSEFGTVGTGPGQFRAVHGVAVDAQGRIYTADRSNQRVQVFDPNGKLLDIWPNIPMPDFIAITQDQHLWVADGNVHRMLKYDLKGQLKDYWGVYGFAPGEFWTIHQFSVDNEGNLYTAEVMGGRAQKFVPKKGVDPARLVGALFPKPVWWK